MRGLGLAAVTAAILLAMASGATAGVRIGSDLSGPELFIDTCANGGHGDCLLVQRTIDTRPVRAPFSGTITRWRVMHPHGTLQLEVVRKRPEGRLRVLRASKPLTELAAGYGEIVVRRAHLRIHRGDLIGIRTDDFYGSYLAGTETSGSCRAQIYPAPAIGTAAKPDVMDCTDELLYNATIRRR